MYPPDELMVQTFLPAMRMLVAKDLHRRGQSQTRISFCLGVTQASVSLYLSADPLRAYSSLDSLSLGREDADRYVSLLAEDSMRSPVDAVQTLGKVWTALIGKGLACGAHRRKYPSLADCDYCMVEFGDKSPGRSEAISEVAEAVRRLESSGSFVSVMPEVSVNLACLAGESESADDIVAIPGRIVKVKNAARSMRGPEFGASRHMAMILLLVRKRKPEACACINLRYDRKMAGVLKRLHLGVLEIGDYSRSDSGDPTAEALRRALADMRGKFDVVVDSGGKGVEPNVYLFAKGAQEVVDGALRISEIYSQA